MNYTVLSPWAEVSSTQVCALNPRLDTLNGRTIGMFSHFKGHSPYILREVEKEILKKYPEARFSYLQYPKDTREIKDDASPFSRPGWTAWTASSPPTAMPVPAPCTTPSTRPTWSAAASPPSC